jgi:hypothetical protein
MTTEIWGASGIAKAPPTVAARLQVPSPGADTLETVPALPARLSGAWRSLERFAESRAAAPTLLALALAVYGIVSIALPLAAGRDLGRYLMVYTQLFDDHVVYPYALLTRTPVAPLMTGGLLELGPVAAELGAAMLYALSILGWTVAARRFGTAAAVATAAALLLYPGYVLLFHELSSDAVYAVGFAGFAVLVAREWERATVWRAAAVGAGVAGLVLIRPVSQVLFLLVLVPLLAEAAWRRRLAGAAAFTAALVAPLVLWAVHNEVRADDFTVVRGGDSSLPLFRAFVKDRIVEPGNGEASEELARAVQRGLLPNEPYRSYGIDLDEFFSSGSARMHEDLIGLSDRGWGWDDDYAHLGRVGREAVLAHPWQYTSGVAQDTWRLLMWPLYSPTVTEPAASPEPAPPPSSTAPSRPDLPVPSEGEPIPAAYQSAFISTPDGRIREVWTSPVDHGIVFREARDRKRAAELDVEMGELLANLPDRQPHTGLLDVVNEASRWYPRPFMWLLVGVVAIGVRRPRRWPLAVSLTAAAILVVLGTSLTVYAVAQYSVPVVPAFVLLTMAGLFGPRAVRHAERG